MQEDLRYISSEKYYEGVISKIEGGAVTIDLKGRLGQFKIPNRMLITDYNPQVGQEVGFMLSNPEVFSSEPNEEYVRKIKSQQKVEESKKIENLTRIEREILEKSKELADLKEEIEKLKSEK
ncbi:CBO2463/CBO2479 domain-containing protein [Peptostreptococcus faecalis]|uniref:CBO2463/CBO2479 domain-containing protein n=1 Tax=Peptostreptococcus faecalis TaxID=2045015 RepID=UPI000C7ABA12|nr:CBO2463/CBO2479 domain-containing protein [Peptostreptococcus faecalis]